MVNKTLKLIDKHRSLLYNCMLMCNNRITLHAMVTENICFIRLNQWFMVSYFRLKSLQFRKCCKSHAVATTYEKNFNQFIVY